MLVSNWKASKRGAPSFASGESAAGMAQAAKLCAGVLLPERKGPVSLGAYSIRLWACRWIPELRGACRKHPLFPEPPGCECGPLNPAGINVPMWCLWNRLQNVLGNCSSSTLLCQLRKHQGSWKTEMTKNCSIQIRKRYFLLWAKRGLLLHCISLIGHWSFLIYFLSHKSVWLYDTSVVMGSPGTYWGVPCIHGQVKHVFDDSHASLQTSTSSCCLHLALWVVINI